MFACLVGKQLLLAVCLLPVSFFFFFVSRFLTGVVCVGVGLQSVFFSKFEEVEGFEGKDHIFTHIQKDARDFIDRNIYVIDPSVVKQAHAKARNGNNNSSGSNAL